MCTCVSVCVHTHAFCLMHLSIRNNYVLLVRMYAFTYVQVHCLCTAICFPEIITYIMFMNVRIHIRFTYYTYVGMT